MINLDLERYLVARQQQDDDRVTAVWNTMTHRERQLVHHVAVMASVRATMRVGSREKPPPDSAVIRDVISACLSMPDLYPAIARLERGAFRRADAAGIAEGNTDDV